MQLLVDDLSSMIPWKFFKALPRRRLIIQVTLHDLSSIILKTFNDKMELQAEDIDQLCTPVINEKSEVEKMQRDTDAALYSLTNRLLMNHVDTDGSG